MRRFYTVTLAILILFIVNTSHAKPGPGSNEISLFVTYSNQSVNNYQFWQIEGQYGRILHKYFEMCGGGYVKQTKSDFTTKEPVFGVLFLSPTLIIPIQNEKYMPFGYVLFGSSFGREDENPIIYGYGAGVKYFITDGGSLNFKLSYNISTYKDDVTDEQVNEGETAFEVGMSLFF